MFSTAKTRTGHALSGAALAALLAVDGLGGLSAGAALARAPAPAPVQGGCAPAAPFPAAAATPYAAPDAATLKADALAVHNNARAAVGVEPMEWDDGLAQGAQYWASMIVKTGVNKHDPDTYGGESISGGDSGALWTAQELMGGWVAEKVWFTNIAFPAAVASCDGRGTGPGHYYGLIRRAAHRVGCGIAGKAPTFRVVVCRYDPGYAPPGEFAYPTTAKPWPARTEPPVKQPWVEGGRYDVQQFVTNMTAVNTAHRGGLQWNAKLAEDAQWDARLRMVAQKHWERVDGSPAAATGEIVNVASHSNPGGDLTDFPAPEVMYRDFLNANADQRGKLAGSTWTQVGCGTAIRRVGNDNQRLVICRYS